MEHANHEGCTSSEVCTLEAHDHTDCETTPPEKTIIEVSILDADGKLYKEVELTKENNWSATVENVPQGTYTVTEATASLTIRKNLTYDLDGSATNENITVKGGIYKFKVEWNDVEKEVSIDLGNESTADDVAVVKGIPVGASYTVTETTNSDAFTSSVAYSKTGTNGGIMENTSTATVTNTYHFFTVSAKKEVVVDAEDLTDAENDAYIKSLEGLTYNFVLTYKDSAGKTVTKKLALKDNESGTFDAVLPYGTEYTVTEEMPEHAAFTSTLTNAQGTITDKVTVTGTNTYKLGEDTDLVIDLVKVNSSGRKKLSGAKFSLYDEDGTFVKSYTSDKNGSIVIEQIKEPGTYTLQETKAPEGYKKLKRAIKIEVENVYMLAKDVNGDPVIVKGLKADVSGNGVKELSDGTYQITNRKVNVWQTGGNPETGDTYNIGLWVGVLVASAAAIVVMLILGKRKTGKFQR